MAAASGLGPCRCNTQEQSTNLDHHGYIAIRMQMTTMTKKQYSAYLSLCMRYLFETHISRRRLATPTMSMNVLVLQSLTCTLAEEGYVEPTMSMNELVSNFLQGMSTQVHMCNAGSCRRSCKSMCWGTTTPAMAAAQALLL